MRVAYIQEVDLIKKQIYYNLYKFNSDMIIEIIISSMMILYITISEIRKPSKSLN